MIRRPPRSTRTDTLFPYTTLFRSLGLLVEKLGRMGKKAGKGFYDYPADGKKRLWPELAQHFPVKAEQPALADVIKRLVYIQSVETARCLEEKVVIDLRDADVGSIMGWGFPPFRGGPEIGRAPA